MDNLSQCSTPSSRTQPEWQNLVSQQSSLVDQQTKIFQQIINTVKSLEEKINKFENDFDILHREVEMLKKAYPQEQQETEVTKNQYWDPMVLALIDGDGYIFKDDLLKQGVEGGREAAQILNEKLMAHFFQEEKTSGSRVQTWTFIFSNLQGLKQTLVACDICKWDEFEAFVKGFTQASPHFFMCDVHSGKEAADAKIRGFLQSWSRFPQMKKIYFGGAHDNGYHPVLAELQSNGLLEKIVLLQGYEQVATEIRLLHLPTLKAEDLFRSHKIQVPGNSGPVKRFPPPSPPLSTSPSPKITYTNAVSCQTTPKIDRPSTNTAPAVSGRRRFPNPNVELHKNNPPPCNMFYLAKCNRGNECRYSHDYILDADHYATLRENARKSPCPAVNSDSPCPHGEQCALGHKCPNGPYCYHRKLDKCWFKGKTMHS